MALSAIAAHAPGASRHLWTEEHVTHEGRFWQFRDLTLERKPIQNPCPIWIATNPKPGLAPPHVVARAVRRVGLMADGWMTDNTPVATFKQRWDLIRQVAREARRPTAVMESALHLRFASWDQQGQLARALADVMPAARALSV